MLFTVILVLLGVAQIFRAMDYSSMKGFILSDMIRNSYAIVRIAAGLDRKDMMPVCEEAKEFYLSYDDLYLDYQKDKKAVKEKFSKMTESRAYEQISIKLLEMAGQDGVDAARLVLVDYTKGTLFTFLTTYYSVEPRDTIWLYQMPGLEPSKLDANTDEASAEWDTLKNNRSMYGEVTSVAHRLYTYNSQGVVIYLFLDTDDSFSSSLARAEIKRIVFAMIISIVIGGFIILMLVRNMVVEPLNRLSKATGSLVSNLDNEEERPHVYQNISINTGDEIEHLYHSVEAMEEGIYSYMDRLKAAVSEKERISTELYIAESIQTHMLPSAEPDFTGQACFDLAASMNPAKEVGGDFYDFFMLDEERLAFLIADVSGKGVPAALVMAIGKTMLKNYTKESGDISEAFRIVNNLLLDTNEESMFITAFEGVLNLRTGELIYVNAGHEDPYVMRNGEEFVLNKEKHSLVLGAMEDMRYKIHRMELYPGDRLFLYTDGVPEAQDHDFNMFGLDGTCRALNKARNESASDLIASITDSVGEFVKEEPQFDDMTMLCLDFKAYYRD